MEGPRAFKPRQSSVRSSGNCSVLLFPVLFNQLELKGDSNSLQLGSYFCSFSISFEIWAHSDMSTVMGKET